MTIMTRSAYSFWHGDELPEHIAYLTKNNPFGDWIPITSEKILNERREKQRINLVGKRRPEFETRPAFVWVFKNETFLFNGWYVYLKLNGRDEALNFRNRHNEEFLPKVFELFPCGLLPGLASISVWAPEFAKLYPHKGFNRGKNQALAVCQVTFKYAQIFDINKRKS